MGASPLSVVFFCGLMGIPGARVRDVPVRVGLSVSVPCPYRPSYTQHVKYLCIGHIWDFCHYSVRTDDPLSKQGHFSIYDDKIQNVFIVTFHNVKREDGTETYWCAVEINDRPDDKERFILSVTKDTPSLWVDHQEVLGYEGESLSVMCHCEGNGKMEWCRLGGSCVRATSGTSDKEFGRSGRTTVRHLKDGFEVTMVNLKMDSSGWYWCASRDLQLPVKVTIRARPPTTTQTPITATPSPSTTPGVTILSTLSSTASAGVGDGLQDKNWGLYTWIALGASLIGLLLVFAVALVVWCKIRACHSTDAKEVSQTRGNPDALYSNVSYACHAAPTEKNENPGDSVTYSTVTMRSKAQVKAEPAEETVTYSSVALHNKPSKD